MILTSAGGVSTNGTHPILDLRPKSKDETSPIFLGSETGVSRLLSHNVSRTYFPSDLQLP